MGLICIINMGPHPIKEKKSGACLVSLNLYTIHMGLFAWIKIVALTGGGHVLGHPHPLPRREKKSGACFVSLHNPHGPYLLVSVLYPIHMVPICIIDKGHTL